MDFAFPQTIQSRDEAFKALQQSGYRLWQWLDHVTHVWWASGRKRVLARESVDGTVKTYPLEPLEWERISRSAGSLADRREVEDIVRRLEDTLNARGE